MVRQGVARGGQGARPRVARAARRDMPPLRRQHIALEFDRAHPRELPQLRAAVGSLPQGNRTVPRGEHHGAQRDQIRAVALHQRRQHAVHIREDRQPIREIHDRRVSGHVGQGVGELSATAAKRHGAERRHIGAARGRHQAVHLPLERRRLAAVAEPRGRVARARQHADRNPKRTGAACPSSSSSTTAS